MLSTQLNKFEEHIHTSINPVFVQKGKVYFYGKYTKGDRYSENYKKAQILGDKYDIVEVLDINIKPNWDKLDIVIENDYFPKFRTYRDDENRYKTFDEYFDEKDGLTLFHSKIFGNEYDERGLLWNFKVRSLRNGDIYTIENYNNIHNGNWGSPISYQDTFYTLDCCEYDGKYSSDKEGNVSSTNFKDFEIDINEESVNTINSFKPELKKRIINNYKFLWALFRSKAKHVQNINTVVVDGTEFMQGMLYEQGHNREYLGSSVIPGGYRFPTKEELDKLAVNHRILKKRTTKEEAYKKRIFRNDAGWEYTLIHDDYGFGNYHHMQLVYMLYNNDINNPSHYFADVMDMYDLNSGDVIDYYGYANSAAEDREYYHSGLYVLVKMTKEEIEEEKKIIDNIFIENNISKNELIDFYKKFGLNSFDDIQSVDFTVSYKNGRYADQDNKVDDTFHREAASHKFDSLKKAIADAFGNQEILNMNKINISYDGNDLVIDNTADVDMKTFMFNITPLLCRTACKCNYVPIQKMTMQENYYSNSFSKHFFDHTDFIDTALLENRINLHMFARSAYQGLALSKKGTANKYGDWNMDSSDLYIINLVLNLKDGTTITIPKDSISYQDLIVSGLYDKYETTNNKEIKYMEFLLSHK